MFLVGSSKLAGDVFLVGSSAISVDVTLARHKSLLSVCAAGGLSMLGLVTDLE